jgi:formylglycine-generating enzyme required for sulfatase activity
MNDHSLRSWVCDPYANLPAKQHVLSIAHELVRANELALAAAVLDRLWARFAADESVSRARSDVLESLAISVLDIPFRFVPEGAFVMGCEDGDPDEQPPHVVQLRPFWIAARPLTLADLSRIQTAYASLNAATESGADRTEQLRSMVQLRIRSRYSMGVVSIERLRAQLEEGQTVDELESNLPLVAINYAQCEQVCTMLAAISRAAFSLPSESQWEKAARGGLHGEPYPWGSEQPSARRCDFERFSAFSLRETDEFAPNGYGVYAMAGSVFEWCSTEYDALAYAQSPVPINAPTKRQRVIRGGSWADCAYACRVSYRAALDPEDGMQPNVGMRPIRWI